MLKHIAAILFVLIPSLARALPALPALIEQNQNLMAQQGTCEATWHDLANSVGVQQKDLGDGNLLWIVPCANWSINLQVTAYVQVPESTQPDGMITKPVLFVSYDPYKGLHGEAVLDNPQFDDKLLTLTGHEYFQSNGECGSAAQYSWNSGLQTFELMKLIKNDTCNGVGKWETVYPPAAPGLAAKWLDYLKRAIRLN